MSQERRKWVEPTPYHPESRTAVWCARRGCVTPLDPVLISEGWTMHPSCEFPALFAASSIRAARP